MGLCLILATAISSRARAQVSGGAGLYVTAEDFSMQKISYPINCESSRDKMKVHDFFGSSSVDVIMNRTKHSFDKSKIYGYKSCTGKNYRFYDYRIYEIVDTKGFFLYCASRSEQVAKGGSVRKAEYFFSAGAGDQILPLSRSNLEKEFARNKKFRYQLDSHFNSENELVAYDPYLKMYKIKYLYTESIK
jgi:hypothetical protein